MSERIVLACASDAGYAPHASVMLTSAITHTPDARFLACFLHPEGFPEQTRWLVEQALKPYRHRVELRFMAIRDEWVAGLPLFQAMKPGLIPPVMWYRVLLPELLPEESRALYVDSDTMVLDDLRPLWKTDLRSTALAAVRNPFWNNGKDRDWLTTMRLADGREYFNSGVMVMDLDHWRQNDIGQAVIAHGRANAGWIRFGDQDSLVAVLCRNFVPLAPRWNVMPAVRFIKNNNSTDLFSSTERDEALRHPAIIHFTGNAKKPWVDPREHPYGRTHQRHARKLPWPVVSAPLSLHDVDHFLTRHHWLRLRRWFRRARERFALR